MKDLTHPRSMWLKAVLFLMIGVVCFSQVLLENPAFRTVVILLLLVWSSCRAYYFLFYVIENYIDPGFRYAGLWALLRQLVMERRSGRTRSGVVRSRQNRANDGTGQFPG